MNFEAVMSEPRFKMYLLEKEFYAPYHSLSHDIFIIDLNIFDEYDQKLQLYMEKANEEDDGAYDVFWIEREVKNKKEVPPPSSNDIPSFPRFAGKISLARVLDEVKILDEFYSKKVDYSLAWLPLLGMEISDENHEMWNENHIILPLFDDIEHDFAIESGFSPLWMISTSSTTQMNIKNMISMFYDQLKKMKIDLFSEFVATRKIQKVWREVIANPSFLVCRKRLMYEFEELMRELGGEEMKQNSIHKKRRMYY